MINKILDEEKIKEALLKRATGYEYEEKEIVADKTGKPGKVKVIKKHLPADLDAIRTVLMKIEQDKW